jgi:hypothetical protein
MKTIRSNPMLRMLGIVALSFSFLLVSGCGGCRDDADSDDVALKEKEEKKKKKKPDFETRTPVLLPGLFPNPEQDESDNEQDRETNPQRILGLDNPAFRFNRTKLGHWATANFQIIANHYNSDGQLSAFSMNSLGQPVGIPSTDYYLTTTRPVSLPKGEWKNLESTVFLPRRKGKTSIANVNYALERSVGGLKQVMLPQPTTLMKPFQHHIVVLSNRPDNYNYLKLTDAVHLRGQQLGNGELVPPFYYVVNSIPGTPNPLPGNGLTWTTIAYLVWDDFDPERLTQEQRDAVLDWIHFGGQLILSGPDCLDRLQFSFLGSYLPAKFAGSRNITNADLKELNENWTVPVINNESEKKIFQVSERVPLLGADFAPHEDADFIEGTGELAIERRLGRGRIVVTAFSLGSPVVRKWRSFPSFLHNALLRKPARQFGKTQDMDISYRWIDDRTSIFDPMLGTTVRFLSRDLSPGLGTPEKPSYSLQQDVSNDTPYYVDVTDQELAERAEKLKGLEARNAENYWHFGGYADAPQSGCGGWNDDSGVSIAARETLQEAAGISPPSSGFVLRMLLAYLAILVPINWAIFRSIGRVEWAWIAAPIIAVVGAVVVVKMASLDIGFVRSNTQIGLLEVYAEYPRAHATEYSALYTSLSTRYNVDLDNSTAQSLPFARTNASAFTQEAESLSRVNLRRTVQNRLEGFQIQSNFTGLLHTECMLDLDGIISCNFDDQQKPTTVSNGSFVELSNAGVAWRDETGQYHLAWIGDLPSGEVSKDLVFESMTPTDLAESWHRVPVFSNTARAARTLWDRFVGADVKSAKLETISTIPDLQDDWDRFQRQLLLLAGTEATDTDRSYSRSDFELTFQSIRQESNVRIGRMFDAVMKSLALAPGESRLIASSDQRIGRNRFDPEATQTDCQTLVVVHLKMPPLPLARRDDNSMTDFMTKSNLDWEADLGNGN